MLDKQAQQFKQLQLATLWNTVDVAQAVRHLVKKAADDNLRQILDAIAEGIESKASADELGQMFDDGYGQIDEIVRNMEHLKNITQPPDRSEGLVDLEKAWRDAYDLVRGRAQYGRDQEIKFNVHGGRAAGIYKGELLKHAFINLILNSQDAFRLGPKNTERRIDVYVEDLGEAAGRVRMRYVDNAGGVSTGQLPIYEATVGDRDGYFHRRSHLKREGSGGGFYLVRNFLAGKRWINWLADGRAKVIWSSPCRRLGSREATGKPYELRPFLCCSWKIRDKLGRYRGRELSRAGFTVVEAMTDSRGERTPSRSGCLALDFAACDVNLGHEAPWGSGSGLELAGELRADNPDLPIVGYSTLLAEEELAGETPFSRVMISNPSAAERKAEFSRWRVEAETHRSDRLRRSQDRLDRYTDAGATGGRHVPVVRSQFTDVTLEKDGFTLKIVEPGERRVCLSGQSATIAHPIPLWVQQTDDLMIAELYRFPILFGIRRDRGEGCRIPFSLIDGYSATLNYGRRILRPIHL